MEAKQLTAESVAVGCTTNAALCYLTLLGRLPKPAFYKWHLHLADHALSCDHGIGPAQQSLMIDILRIRDFTGATYADANANCAAVNWISTICFIYLNEAEAAQVSKWIFK